MLSFIGSYSLDAALIISGLSYLISSILYAHRFQRADAGQSKRNLAILLVGFAAQSVLLGILTYEAGTVPLTTQVLPTLCAWLVVIVYVYLEVSTAQQALGALIVPIVTLLHLLAIPDLYGTERVMPVEHSGGWFRLHVLAYILAYVAFAISCVSALMYVMLLGEIQKKHLGYFYERLPSLDSLNQVNNRAATFGFILLTAGVVSSTVWAHQELDTVWVWGEPTVAPLLLTWVIYAGHLWARYMSGWQGRRAAMLSIAGFTVVVLAFPVVGVFFSGVHPFGN
ncbi:TPA: hypothetical protein DCE37_18470 [Candidatus Latescibacteria bacterium]|nr:hypothetical protein [Candidatus Latescibacterota bacterium]